MGKLVRGRIPNLIRESGRIPRVNTLSGRDYRAALLEKLREEVMELAAEQTREGVLAEAADVLEVLAAIAVDHDATLDTIVDVARRKREERGGFAMRLWLEDADLNPRCP